MSSINYFSYSKNNNNNYYYYSNYEQKYTNTINHIFYIG